jgi:hypothetical protein
MSPEALKLNEPCRFYKGQVGGGGWLWALQLGRSNKEPGPYAGVDKREEERAKLRTMLARNAAEGNPLAEPKPQFLINRETGAVMG